MSQETSAAPLRILWIASKLSFAGGIGRVLHGAAPALAALGHEVHLAGPAPDGAPPTLPGVAMHPWPVRRWKFQQLPALLRLQRELRADVVHFHAALAHGELIAALRTLRARGDRPAIFVTPHTAARTDYPKLRARLGLRLADAVLTPSRWSAQRAIGAGAREATTHEVYAGIELARPTPIEKREPLVVALGRLIPVKGFDVLIDAFERVSGARPQWRLVIGGEGRQGNALRARARACSAAQRIELPGQIVGAAKGDLLSRASIGVVPSHSESFGGVLLEFEAAGLACIATPAGGMAELADEGRAARQVPAGDVEALAKALGELMDDPTLRRDLGGRALELAGRLSWPAAARRYEALYRLHLR